MASKFKILIFTALAFGSIDGGIIQEFDHAFGSFSKLPVLFKRWSHPHPSLPKKTSSFPPASEGLLRMGDQASERDLIISKRIGEPPLEEFEQLPQPMHQKQTTKGYVRDDETYILEDSNGTPCVMAYFKATITVYYPTNKKEEKYDSRIVTPPNDVKVSGKCDRDALIAILDLTWSKGTLSLRFAFDDLIDSWFVDQFKFTFDTSNYKGAEKDETVVLLSEESRRFWTTSHAKSFRCLLLHDVSLMNDGESYSGTIHFNEARVQALSMTKTFKTPKHCIHRVHRDEMVPITVGGSLCGLTLLTIAGYAAFRYFKVKKFQYGTME